MTRLTEGPLLKSVLRVGVPASCFQLLIFANNVIDFLWVKTLGDEAASGLTAGWTAFWMLASLGQVFSTGVTAIVARRVGEQKPGAAVHAATHGVKAALLGALVVGALGWLFIPSLVQGNRLSPQASQYTLDYLRTLCAGAPLLFLFYAFEGTFKGRGDMRRPFRALLAAVVINMALSPAWRFSGRPWRPSSRSPLPGCCSARRPCAAPGSAGTARPSTCASSAGCCASAHRSPCTASSSARSTSSSCAR
ncbi:MAG: MATE family efflux transporter [Planctomycetota bacterium]